MTTGASLTAPGVLAPVPDVTANWKPEVYKGGVTIGRNLNATTEGDPVADYLPARDFYENGLSPDDQAALHLNVAYAVRTVSDAADERQPCALGWQR